MARFCTNCGNEVAEGMKFCTNCGAPMPIEEVAAPIVEEAAPVVEEKVEEVVAPVVEEVAPVVEEAAPVVEEVAPVVEEVAPVVEEAAPVEIPVEVPAEPATIEVPSAPVEEPAQSSDAFIQVPVGNIEEPKAPEAPAEPVKPEKPAKPEKVKKEKAPKAPKEKKGGAGKIIGIIVAIVLAVALIGGGAWYLITNVFGGAKLPEVKQKKFISTVEAQLDIDSDDLLISEGKKVTEVVGVSDDGVIVCYATYNDEEKALKAFEDLIDLDTFKGTSEAHGRGNSQYILIDGKLDGEKVYGGAYINGNTVIYVIGPSSEKKDINKVLEALELPTL